MLMLQSTIKRLNYDRLPETSVSQCEQSLHRGWLSALSIGKATMSESRLCLPHSSSSSTWTETSTSTPFWGTWFQHDKSLACFYKMHFIILRLLANVHMAILILHATHDWVHWCMIYCPLHIEQITVGELISMPDRKSHGHKQMLHIVQTSILTGLSVKENAMQTNVKVPSRIHRAWPQPGSWNKVIKKPQLYVTCLQGSSSYFEHNKTANFFSHESWQGKFWDVIWCQWSWK